MISIYIHWPFCVSKCPYCDFNSHVSKTIDYEIWLQKYLQEIVLYKELIRGNKIKSIFFGGGTPSLMRSFMVEEILKKINEISSISEAEITLEANPTSFESQKFKEFKSAGINRISLGVQSFKDHNLKFLGRNHSSNEAISAIEEIRKIFDNYSFDLIYAIPSQNLSDWKNELDFALKFSPPHISLYQLTIEPGTKFSVMYKLKKLIPMNLDLQSELYIDTGHILKENGYVHYEISNYSKPRFESQHNLGYWKYLPYIGIGPGAHGRLHLKKGTSFGRFSSIGQDMVLATKSISSPKSWLYSDEKTELIELSNKEILTEKCLMNLRIEDGLRFDSLLKHLNKDPRTLFEENLKKYKKYFEVSDESLKVRPEYRQFTDYLIEKVVKVYLEFSE